MVPFLAMQINNGKYMEVLYERHSDMNVFAFNDVFIFRVPFYFDSFQNYIWYVFVMYRCRMMHGI